MNTTTNEETQNQDQNKTGCNETAQRAYQLWKTAGQPAGRDLEFWLEAETELRTAKKSQPSQMLEQRRSR